MPLIQYLARILFDFGAVRMLGDEIGRLGIRRPLLVTDKGVAAAGILDCVLAAALPVRPVLYDGTPGNPTEAALLDCLGLWSEAGCDGVIALGGGSSIDLSKAVALIASHGGRLRDYEVRGGGSDRIGKVAPQIAIPTAAGTGAEVGRACVMTLLDGSKSVAVSLDMVADTVICDPELTLTLPPRLTAATGIDALSHGIEAVLSPVINPPARAIALDAIARAAGWLPRAFADGRDRQARWQMMMAALEGGMCLQKSLGAAHALANPLGERGLHHGTLIGILLPHVVRFNEPAAPDDCRDIRAAAGVAGDETLADWVADLARQVELPGRLAELGVTADMLGPLAARAAREHLAATNPRPFGEDEALSLLQAAL